MKQVLLDMRYLSPILIVAATALAILMIDVFSKKGRKDYLGYIAMVGLAASAVASYVYWGVKGAPVARLLFSGTISVDNYGLFFNFAFLAFAALAMLQSMAYLKEHNLEHGEYYALMLFSTCGMMIMASAADMITLVLGLETMSIPIYVLAAFNRESKLSAEAGLKYFLLGAFATAILLYGMALLYGALGTTSLKEMALGLSRDRTLISDPFVIVGMVMVGVGFAFKVAAVPFHMWVPDVYQGAPTPITSFMACAVKAAAFAALVRVFTSAFFDSSLAAGGWYKVMAVIAVLTMTAGNLMALLQKNLKRMLAFSGIAHAGFILIGLLAAAIHSRGAVSSILYYLLAYGFTIMGAFGMMMLWEKRGDRNLTLDDYRGLGRKQPLAALMMTFFLLSLAGIPPLAGFFGKFYVLKSALEAGTASGASSLYYLVIIAVLNSVIAAFYYLRVTVMMYMKPAEKDMERVASIPLTVALLIAALLVLAMGLMPDFFLSGANKSIDALNIIARI